MTEISKWFENNENVIFKKNIRIYGCIKVVQKMVCYLMVTLKKFPFDVKMNSDFWKFKKNSTTNFQ